MSFALKRVPPRGAFVLDAYHWLEVTPFGEHVRLRYATDGFKGVEGVAWLMTPQRARVLLRQLNKAAEIAAEWKRTAKLMRSGHDAGCVCARCRRRVRDAARKAGF